MPKITSNWNRLRDRDVGDTTQYRNVYEDQQLERTKIQAKKTMTSRNIANAALTVGVFFLSYVVIGMIAGIAAKLYGYDNNAHSFGYYVGHFSFSRILICLLLSAAFFGIMYVIFKHNLDVQNSLNDTSDINQYQNDQHIALPEEIQRKFDWFPDVGCTSDVQFSSMISHCALSNKGLKTISVARRVPSDITDDDGEVLLHKGEILTDEDGDALTEEKPLIDTEFMHALYTASGLPDRKDMRKFYNATMIPYNPDNRDRDKLKGYETVADLINNDWELPEYEPQRPGGAYLVDTAPVDGYDFINALVVFIWPSAMNPLLNCGS